MPRGFFSRLTALQESGLYDVVLKSYERVMSGSSRGTSGGRSIFIN